MPCAKPRTPRPPRRLLPYLAGLAGAPNPDSRLRWLQSPALSLLEALLAGTVELSHAGLDRAQGAAFPARAVAFLRAGLVDHGALEALEARDEHSGSGPRAPMHGRSLPQSLQVASGGS